MNNATEKGTIKMTLNVKGNEVPVKLKDVLYVPELQENILSVGQMTNKGYKVSFMRNKCYINDTDGDLIATGTKHENVYYLDVKNVKLNQKVAHKKNMSENKIKKILHVKVKETNKIFSEKDNERKSTEDKAEKLNFILIKDHETKVQVTEKLRQKITIDDQRKNKDLNEEKKIEIKKKYKTRFFWNKNYLREHKQVLIDENKFLCENKIIDTSLTEHETDASFYERNKFEKWRLAKFKLFKSRVSYKEETTFLKCPMNKNY